MQRPGETQEEHYFELTNVDGAHLYANAGSEGSASDNPKPVLMRTTTGKTITKTPRKKDPCKMLVGLSIVKLQQIATASLSKEQSKRHGDLKDRMQSLTH